MKLLHKLLGVSDYIENLENTYTDLLTKNTELRTKLKHTEQELDKSFSSLNELLATKTRLTAEVIKLREQVETLEQSNSEYLDANEDLIKEVKQYKDTEEEWLKHDKESRLDISNQLLQLAEHIVEYL